MKMALNFFWHEMEQRIMKIREAIEINGMKLKNSHLFGVLC